MAEAAEQDETTARVSAPEQVAAEPLPGWGRRRRRAVATLLLIAFALALLSPFYFSPRVRLILSPVPAIRLTLAKAALAGRIVPPVRLDSAESIVRREVRRGGFPGGALAVGVGPVPLLEEGVGRTRWGRLAPPVDARATLYDLASLTKVVATTTAVMVLVDDGRMHLDDPVSRWLPHFSGGGREKVTVRQLLTHTSGLPAGRPVEGATPGDRLYHLVKSTPLIARPGEAVLYSDVGFVVLGLAAGEAAGEPLPAFLRKRVWQPLGMKDTRFEPGPPCAACAPTLTLEDGTPLAGRTNDPFARELGGITGNAGLFSTGHDMARFAAMLANGGALDGVRIVRAETLRTFLQLQPHAGTRALGFEWFCQEGTVPDNAGCRHPYAYGHTGYTGTSLWIDPRTGAWVVLLTNRTYLPKAENQIRVIRRRLFNTITGQHTTPAPSDTTAETH